MPYKTFIISLLALLPFWAHAQKAYETVRYTGELQGQTVSLNLANGYIGGSEIRMMMTPKTNIILFRPDSGVPDEQSQLQFSADEKPGHFILSNMQEAYDQPPAIIYGHFTSDSKTTAIKFIRKKS